MLSNEIAALVQAYDGPIKICAPRYAGVLPTRTAAFNLFVNDTLAHSMLSDWQSPAPLETKEY